MTRAGVWSILPFAAGLAACNRAELPCGSEVALDAAFTTHVGLSGGQVATLGFEQEGVRLERFSLENGQLTRLETQRIPNGRAVAASGDVLVVEVGGRRRILEVSEGFPLLYEEPSSGDAAVGGTVVYTGSHVLDAAATPVVAEPVGPPPTFWTPILDGYRTVWPNTPSPEFATLPGLDDLRELNLHQGVPQLGIDDEVFVRHAAFLGDQVWLNVATDENRRRFLIEVDWETALPLRGVEIHTDAGFVFAVGERLYLDRSDGVIEVLDVETLERVGSHDIGSYLGTVRVDEAHAVWMSDDFQTLNAARVECL
ncbi:MAG: hypothetical protein R3F61_34010 [Myxococcota bacterium]